MSHNLENVNPNISHKSLNSHKSHNKDHHLSSKEKMCLKCNNTGLVAGKACADCPHHIVKEKQMVVDEYANYPHNSTIGHHEGHLNDSVKLTELHAQNVKNLGETYIHDHKITNIPVTAEVPTTHLKTVTKEMNVTAEVPTHTLKTVTQNMNVTAEVPTTNLKTVTTNVPIIAEVPVTTVKTITQNIPVTAEVPVTNLKKVKKMVEVETEVPVTVLKTVKKLVEVETEVPVTELKEVTRMIPVTTEVPVHTTKRIETTMQVETSVPTETVKRVATNINVESTVPVQGIKHVNAHIGVQSTVPVQGSKLVGATIPVEMHTHEKIGIQTQHIEGIKKVGLEEVLHAPSGHSHITKEVHAHNHPQDIKVTLETTPVIKEKVNIHHTGGDMYTYTDTKHLGNSTRIVDLKNVKGFKDCKLCSGAGYKLSKSGKYGKYRTCKECVRQTGMCYFCNDGMLIEYPDRRCPCIFGETRRMK